MLSKPFRSAALIASVLFIFGCAATEQPYHGFTTQQDLNRVDAQVMAETSPGGPMDPYKLSKADQRYGHNGIAYNKEEEGFYQWGAKMYQLGYRDIYYVRDLAPKALKREEILDIYDKALQAGFEDAMEASKK